MAQHRSSNAALLVPPVEYDDAPLDLTKKRVPTKTVQSDIPFHSVPAKSESEECEISGEMKKKSVKLHPEETCTKVRCKRFKPDPMDLSQLDDSTEMSRLVIDIKEEPASPGIKTESM